MDAAFFTHNRKRLRGQLEPDSFAAFSAFGAMQRDVDQPFAFQQESNFWYLTGIEEPDWLLVMDTDTGDEWLIAPKLNRYQAVFDGGMSPAEAAKRTGVTTVLAKQEGKTLIEKLLKQKKRAYALVPQSSRIYGFQPNAAPRKLLRQLKGVDIIDVRLPLAKLRAIKQPVEIEAIQAAVDVTVDGMLAVLKELKHYTHEHQIDAKLYHEFRTRGATHGFDPIVASGRKTCIMHSPAANDPLQGWLLLDVGARVRGYTADITRTIPLRPPTERQRQVYEAVERMHDYFLGLLKPGASTKETLMQQAYPFVGEEMVRLGIIKKPLLNHQHIFKFMPHGITHGLGIDGHDPLGKPETFQEGMVLTDEVGVYIPEEGFGIRLENDIVITKDGARNMAAKLPLHLDTLAEMVY